MNCKFCSKGLKENRKFKFKEFCNHSCKAKFQFLDPWQHKIRSIKIREQIKREDRKNKWSEEKLRDLTKNARKVSHPKLKKLIKKGRHPFQIKRWDTLNDNDPKKIKIIKKLKDRKGEKNPMHKSKHNESFWNGIRQMRKQFWRDHPDKHPNRIMAQKGFISKPQYELYLLIKSKFPEAELEYPIKTKHSIRFADIAIPSLKLDIEYDGLHWHQNKQMDDLRDKHLVEVGWTTIRFSKDNVQLCLSKLQEII